MANTLGANVIAVGFKNEKLAIARDLGAVETVNAADVGGVPDEIHDITDTDRCNL